VVNADQAPHTVTGGGSSGFDTGTIQGGSSGSFTAPTAPGNYAYICSVHPYMHGTLVVTS
jgi:plastocyanin